MAEHSAPLPVALTEASGVPFYRQIVDQLGELIRSGQLEPGTRLPAVRELTQQLLVSLITVRRAYADLEQASLIVRKQGQGTFVAQDVGEACKERSLDEAREGLRQAVLRARRLGMSSGAQRAWLEEMLGGEHA